MKSFKVCENRLGENMSTLNIFRLSPCYSLQDNKAGHGGLQYQNLGGLRQEDDGFKVSLGCVVRPYVKEQNEHKPGGWRDGGKEC